jgi:hypothetical protein
MSFTGNDRDDLAFGIDHDNAWPGLNGKLPPQRMLRIVGDRMPDLQAIDRLEHDAGIALVWILRGVHADDGQTVVIAALQMGKIRQQVPAVDVVVAPEPEQHDTTTQARHQGCITDVDPFESCWKLGRWQAGDHACPVTGVAGTWQMQALRLRL